MSYQVKLEVYEGPFDLLLQLIARRKVDIYEVDLAEITADFLGSLQDLHELDLDTATRFLVVAATLIELKAARLLPRADQEELEDLLGEARDLLYARLLEYRAFRDVAAELRARLELHEHLVARDVPLEGRFQRLAPETPLAIGPDQLAALAAGATAPAVPERVDLSHIRKSYIAIRDAARLVLGELPAPGAATTFRALVADRSRGDRVVFFLALLELYKLGHLELVQPDARGALEVARRAGGRDLESITDEYEGDAEARAANDEAAGGAEVADGTEAAEAAEAAEVAGHAGVAEPAEPSTQPTWSG